MSKTFAARRLDLKSFAQEAGTLKGTSPLAAYPRLAAEAQGDLAGCDVAWEAAGQLRPVRGGPSQIWLNLRADALVPLTCQRCLTPVQMPVSFERDFRFVPDEATAAAEDEEAEEDVLALSPAFDLQELVEDELLMELPLVPRHETCPVEVKLAAVDPAFEEEMAAKANPFAALARLKE